jgi:hypothetical protein
LESADAPAENRSGGFLDTMRETIFGQNQTHGSVPNVPPPDAPGRPVWNSGQTAQRQGQYEQAPYGASQPPLGGGGGSFLGTAAAAAAGMVGGSLLLGSIRSMMGGSHQGFGDASAFGGAGGGQSPWASQSDSELARQAGIDDIGGSSGRADDSSRAGSFDTASNEYPDDTDDVDLDASDVGGDSDSDYA